MMRIPNLSTRQLTLMMAAGLLLIAGSGLAWLQWVYRNPYNVYWGMIEQNLQTDSYTRRLQQTNSQTHIDQLTRMQFATSNTAQTNTTLKQGSSTVKTETIGTKDREVLRYTQLDNGDSTTGAQQAAVKALLNKWASTDVKDAGDQLPVFEQTTFGLAGGNVLPIVSLDATDRDRVLHKLHNEVIFDVDFAKVERQQRQGRSVFVYPVKVQAVGYAGLQKDLATILGYKLFDDLEPNEYQGQQPTVVSVVVDAWSHNLVEVAYAGQKRIETYSDYGVQKPVSLPKAVMSGQQLRDKLRMTQSPQ